MGDLDWLEEKASTSPNEATALAAVMLLEEIRELKGTIRTMADDLADIKELVRDINPASDVVIEVGACTDRLVERLDEIGEKIEKGLEAVVEKLDED